MTMPREGWKKKNLEIRKERLRAVLRKEPYLETKWLVDRFQLSKYTVLKVKKEIYKELNIKPLNSPYITLKESRASMREIVRPWRPQKKNLDKAD